jgi:hypothetical protein
MFELIGLYRGGPGRGNSAGFLFEGMVGRPANDWDQARRTAQQLLALPLDHPSRPLRIRIRPAQRAKT